MLKYTKTVQIVERRVYGLEQDWYDGYKWWNIDGRLREEQKEGTSSSCFSLSIIASEILEMDSWVAITPYAIVLNLLTATKHELTTLITFHACGQ